MSDVELEKALQHVKDAEDAFNVYLGEVKDKKRQADAFLEQRHREAIYWAKVKAKQEPDPHEKLIMNGSKAQLAKEIFELKQTVGRQAQIIEEFKQRIEDLTNAKKNLELQLAEALSPPVPPKSKSKRTKED